MIIKALDARGAFVIHEDIKAVTVHQGAYVWSFMPGSPASPIFDDFYLPTHPCQDKGGWDLWVDRRTWEDEGKHIDSNQHVKRMESGSIDARVTVVDAELKGGGFRRYLISAIAYVCNDDGKTIHKVELPA